MKLFAKIKKLSPAFLLVCGVIALCFWYTRPLSVNSLVRGSNVISVSLFSTTFQYDDDSSSTSKSFFTKDADEIEPIVELLNNYKLRRKLPFVKYISYQGDEIGKNGLTIIHAYISTDDANSHAVSFEVSQNGRVGLNSNPAGVGYFTKRKALELFGTLLEIVEQKGAPNEPINTLEELNAWRETLEQDGTRLEIPVSWLDLYEQEEAPAEQP